jgi:ABC-type antimicrobial peptide transport system permease subunit
MFRNYFKTAFRNLQRNKLYSFINIAGLAIGIAVVILIGLWISSELSFNKSFKNYGRIVQIIQNDENGSNNGINTMSWMPIPAAVELRNKYGADFKYIALSKESGPCILTFGDKKLSKNGMYAEPQFPDMFSLQMIAGTKSGFNDPSSIMINQSLAKALFGNADPIGKMIRIDNKNNLKVTGVYQDFPLNTNLYGISFLAPWDYLVADQSWVKAGYEQWDNNSFILYAQLGDRANMNQVGNAVKDLMKGKSDRRDKPELILQPMSQWHLYNEFKNGKNVGGAIKYVRIFGIIGLFVLLLACINFMNLSTARSQKRAKEVGIRKAVGSVRKQLILQFLAESVMTACIALLIAVLLVQLALPWFDHLAGKEIHFPWDSVSFWGLTAGLTLITGLIAGTYPAFYLSSFNAVKVLKGAYKAGRFATIPRKVLVVFQFAVSVALIISMVIIFQQIQHAKDRPLGYDQNGLITIPMSTPDLYGKYDLLRNDLINSGAAVNMAEATNPATWVASHQIGFNWQGKDPNTRPVFGVIGVTPDFGKTVSWQFIKGRDFSRNFPTDSLGMILNEKAAALIGFKNPIGETIQFNGQNFHVIGVIENMIMESPFAESEPAVFLMDYNNAGYITVKLNPDMNPHHSLVEVGKIFRKYDPSAPFNYTFVDQDYAQKFTSEERIGSLATFFALFAILISCLGIFGLASFIAEQRTKEIGIRKVLGAKVSGIWMMLSKDFLWLVIISFGIAMPVSWYAMHHWLQNYDYRISISIWVFAITAVVTIMITLGTVSFQAIRAAAANPVESLRTE